MPRILRTAQSRLDYDEIWDFIADDNPGAADALIGLLEETVHLLGASPCLGRKRFELSSGLRSFPVGSYVLFYHPKPDGIELIRVLHGARDIQSDFFS